MQDNPADEESKVRQEINESEVIDDAEVVNKLDK